MLCVWAADLSAQCAWSYVSGMCMSEHSLPPSVANSGGKRWPQHDKNSDLHKVQHLQSAIYSQVTHNSRAHVMMGQSAVCLSVATCRMT
jgi:hypothetical protein